MVTDMSDSCISKKLIGLKIKQQRKRLGLTQFQLAELVGLHEKQISRIESGLNYPTFENFVNITKSLSLNMSDFEVNDTLAKSLVYNDLYYLINSANERELKLYLDVLSSVKKNLSDFEKP